MKIRSVEDAKENLERVVRDILNDEPNDPVLLKAAEKAVKRMKNG